MMLFLKVFFIVTYLLKFSFGGLEGLPVFGEGDTSDGDVDDDSDGDGRNLQTSSSVRGHRNKQLQRLWHEWNLCTNALGNDFFTPMTEIVPKDVLFLTTYYDEELFPTRHVTIPPGKLTTFILIYYGRTADYTDDWELGLCGSNTPEEAEKIRKKDAEAGVEFFRSSEFTSEIYYKIDGVDAEPLFVRDTGPYYLIGCSDNRTYEEYSNVTNTPGDPCDEEEFQQINGLDFFPLWGWWGKDNNRKWVSGETHTYEFGIPIANYTARYIITAE